MPRGALSAVARHLRHLAGAPAGAVTDAELLRRYVSDRDEGAFAGLVERHGPLVWAVCRRALRRPEDAEDAFQATFLVLARKAASIREAGKVSSWLYGVAYRTAMRAKQSAARRWQQERRAPARAPEQPVTEAALHELQALLDEEVQRLPEKYRAPFVLCCLEGRSRAEAARELGWKEGTVAGRVAEARERLRQRLARRGVALAAALCAVEVGQGAASALPPAVAAAAREAARGAASARAAALARGIIRAMLATQLKGGAALLLALGLLAASTAAAARQALAAPQPVAQQAEAAPHPAAGPEQTQRQRGPARIDRYGDPLPAGAVARLGTIRFRHGFYTATVIFSPDGKILASAGKARGGVVFWDPHTGRPLRRLPWPRYASRITFSPDGRLLFVADSRALFDVATGDAVRQFQGGRTSCECAAFSPDGRMIAAGEWRPTCSVYLWDVATGVEIRQFKGHTGEVLAVAFSPDGKTLASGSGDRTVRLWDVTTGKERLRLQGHTGTVRAIAFSPDGAVLASAGEDAAIRLWDPTTGKELRRFIGHEGPVWSLAFAPDGKHLASGGRDRTFRIWDLSTGREVRHWETPSPAVTSVAYSPDGRVVASSGSYDCIRLWDAATGKEIAPPTGAHTGIVDLLRFTPDDKELVSHGRDGKLLVWDVARGNVLEELFGGPVGQMWTGSALSPDDKTLALKGLFFAGSKAAPVIRLWDTATAKELHTLTGDAAPGPAWPFRRMVNGSPRAAAATGWYGSGMLPLARNCTGWVRTRAGLMP